MPGSYAANLHQASRSEILAQYLYQKTGRIRIYHTMLRFVLDKSKLPGSPLLRPGEGRNGGFVPWGSMGSEKQATAREFTRAPGPSAPGQPAPDPVVQRRVDGARGGEVAADAAAVHASAEHGIATPAWPLPHAAAIQSGFGRPDISALRAHVGPEAAASARHGRLGLRDGDHVVLGASTDLFTVAHEAAHVVQQRGGV